MSSLVVWRLCAAKYASTAFDGEGARRYGGRWSPKGFRVNYTAESRALAVVEILAQVDERTRLVDLPWVLISAEFPESLVEKPARYPTDWRQFPHSRATQAFGESWLKESRTAALRIPSVVVPGEFNYLLNPAHRDFARVKIAQPEPFTFDPRLA